MAYEVGNAAVGIVVTSRATPLVMRNSMPPFKLNPPSEFEPIKNVLLETPKADVLVPLATEFPST